MIPLHRERPLPGRIHQRRYHLTVGHCRIRKGHHFLRDTLLPAGRSGDHDAARRDLRLHPTAGTHSDNDPRTGTPQALKGNGRTAAANAVGHHRNGYTLIQSRIRPVFPVLRQTAGFRQPLGNTLRPGGIAAHQNPGRDVTLSKMDTG